MRRQVCFNYQDKRYVTIFGCGDYLSTVKQEWPGITEVMNIMLKSGFSTSFTKEFGINIRSVPELTNVTVTSLGADGIQVNGILRGENGTGHSVLINKNGLTIDGKLEGADPEPVKEETKQNPEPAKEEPKLEPKKEEPKQESFDEEPKLEPVKEEPKVDPEPVKEEKKPEPVKDITGKVGTIEPTGEIDMSVGFHMGKASGKNSYLFGKESSGVNGFTCHAKPLRRQPYRPAPMNQTPNVSVNVEVEDKSMPIDPEIENAPDKPVATVPNEVLQNLANRWAPKQNNDAVHKDVDQQKQIKDRLRANFSPEVNAVIGDIPHLLLDDISEFTMNPVDYEALKDQGLSYCIQQHWHKCGNWFCIDVVTSRKRVFYNSKKNLIVDIAVDDCKAWLKAVS